MRLARMARVGVTEGRRVFEGRLLPLLDARRFLALSSPPPSLPLSLSSPSLPPQSLASSNFFAAFAAAVSITAALESSSPFFSSMLRLAVRRQRTVVQMLVNFEASLYLRTRASSVLALRSTDYWPVIALVARPAAPPGGQAQPLRQECRCPSWRSTELEPR